MNFEGKNEMSESLKARGGDEYRLWLKAFGKSKPFSVCVLLRTVVRLQLATS
jgi:hypothetical protein